MLYIISGKIHPVLPRINVLPLFIFCCLSSFTATVYCDPRTLIRSGAFHFPVSADKFRNRTVKALETQGIASVRKMDGAVNNSSVVPSDEIGGGRVNEKERQYRSGSQKQHKNSSPLTSCSTVSSQRDDGTNPNFEPAYDPSNHRSHLLHAIEGLNRYPNYLSRWKCDDVDALEEGLERVLEKVREQKSKTEDHRKHMQLAVRQFYLENPEWKQFSTRPESWDDIRNILDPRAAKAIFRSRKFRKQIETITVNDIIDGRASIELENGYLEEWMDEEMFDVYSFPLLSETFCHKLCMYVSGILAHVELSRKALNYTMSSCYKDLDNLGLGWLNDLIFHLILRPVSAQLYKDIELRGGDLDWRQGFIAAYSSDPTTSKPRQRLVAHTDDSEVRTH